MMEAIVNRTLHDPITRRPVFIKKGVTRFVEDDPIVIEHPDWWKPAEGQTDRARSTDTYRLSPPPTFRTGPGRTADRPRHDEAWRLPNQADVCRVRLNRSSAGVRFAAEPRTRMVEEFEHHGVNVEHGILFFGHAGPTSADPRTLLEVLSVRPVRLGLGTRDSLRFDRSDLELVLDGHDGLPCVGMGHSHPGTSAQPSPEDLDFWTTCRRATGLSHWLGLLALPLRDHWELRAWIVRAGLDDRDVAEPSRSL